MEKKDRLETIRSRGFLGLEVGHRVTDRVRGDNIGEVLHDGRGEGGCVIVVRQVIGGRLRGMGPEEQVSSILTRTSGRTVRFEEGTNVLNFLARKDMHESAGRAGTGGTFHMFLPGSATAAPTLPTVAELSRSPMRWAF